MDSEERTYRRWVGSGDLHTFEVRIGESDLLISAERPLRESAERTLCLARVWLQRYLAQDPEFEKALRPREAIGLAPPIVQTMLDAAKACGVGPMAAVAGAIADAVGEALLDESREVIVENGGDIFLYTMRPRVAAVYAGTSPLSGTLGLRISQLDIPLGLCTSSGTVGPSLSFGKADAAIVLAESAALADAAATALGNRVKTAADIEPALKVISEIPGIYGLAAVIGENLGAWGEMEFVRLNVPDGSDLSG